MRTLVIDCATEACSVALFERGDLVSGCFELLGRGHAERLVPMISELPGRGRAERIAAALGPGSFTGVRVGLATARALALAWGAAFVGYPTLALVAAMARERAGPVAVGVAMTGGHGEWFVESFDAGGLSVQPVASLAPEEAVAAAGEDVIAGSQASALVEARGRGIAIDLLPDARCFPALPSDALLNEPAPLYGRGPDAKLPGAAS